MSDIKAWKTPAASNVAVAPDGFPEGMLRSDVNNSSRELMASLRRFWDDPDWKNPVDGFTVVQGSDDTKVTIQATDARSYFVKNQKVRISSTSSARAYAFVVSSALSGSDTVVTLEDFDTTGTPTPSTTVPGDCNGIEVYLIGGDITGNHGIGRGAFENSLSVNFEVPASLTTADLQTAVTSAESSGKIVLLDTGTYNITAPIAIASSVQIWGRGSGKSILKLADTTNDQVLAIGNNVSDVSLYNFKVDGNQANQSTAGHGIRFGDNASRIWINQVVVSDCQNHGITFSGTTTGGGEKIADVWISHCLIDTVGNTAININDANGLNKGITISDVVIRDFGDSGTASESSATAAAINTEGRVQISNVSIDANSATPHASFAGACMRSVKATSSGSPKGGHKNQWSNIRIEGAMAGCIGFEIGGEDVQLSNSYVNLTGSGTITPLLVAGTGAGVEDASDVVISNVFLQGGTISEIQGTAPRAILNGVHFQGGANGLRVGGIETRLTGCVFDGQTSTYALQIQNGSNNCVISGCSFRDIAQDAIQVAGDSNTITGCTFDSVTGDGIQVDATGDLNRIAGSVFNSVTGSNMNDLGTNTRIDRSSNPSGWYKRANLTANQNNIGTGETVAVGMDAVTFPQGANGSREYRVRVVLIMDSANNSVDINVRIRKGTLGTTSDAEFSNITALGTGVSPYDQAFVFDSFVLTPATGEMLTVTADPVGGFTTKDILTGPIVVGGSVSNDILATSYLTSHIEMELMNE